MLRQLVHTAEIKTAFSRGDSTNWSYKLSTITEIIHDTTPTYRINYLPERYSQNLLLSTKLTLDENNQVMKKVNLIQYYNEEKMELTENEIKKKHGTLCKHSYRNTLVPYEYELTCISCGYNVIKRTLELTMIQRKKNFIDRLKYAEHKIFCICVEVYKNYEGNEYDKIYEVLLTLKNKKININNNLIENDKDFRENPEFEQDYFSGAAIGKYKFGHDSIRLLKWLAYYDRSYYVNTKNYDLMGSILK